MSTKRRCIFYEICRKIFHFAQQLWHQHLQLSLVEKKQEFKCKEVEDVIAVIESPPIYD
jgi:hypothetical protein